MKKKLIAGGAALALVAGAGGAAFAYFTATGDGTGSATVGSPSDWVVSTDTVVYTGDTALTPQPDACRTGQTCAVYESMAYHVQNPNSGTEHLSNVLIKIANANGTPWTAVAGCSASDFSIDYGAAGSPENDTALAGDIAAGVTVDGAIQVTMIDNGLDQNACKNASVPLYLHAS
jgi:hypothetical protein